MIPRRLLVIGTVLMVILLFFQYRITKPTNLGRLTETERTAQLRRMNEYPPFAYRLANLLEARPEAVAYYKLERNFIDNFDLSRFFMIETHPLLLPFFLLGIFEAVRRNPKPVLLLISLPIIFQTIVGFDNPKGPLGLLLVIYAGAVFGLIRLIGAIRRKYEK